MSLISVSKKQAGTFITFLSSLLCPFQAQSHDFESQCCGWTVSADFLAWYASEDIASIWADVITIDNNPGSWDAVGFDFKWDAGFRIGLQRALDYDCWDTAFYWTWFRTSNTHEIPFTPGSTISPEFFAAFLSGNTPRGMSAHWSLLFNTLDWEVGRRYWICEDVSIRPFMGLKGGWINQSIKAHYNDLILVIDDIPIPTNLTGTERLKNNFFGIGPQVGLNSNWRIGSLGAHSLYLFGDFSLATLYGNWACNDFYSNEIGQTSSVTNRDSLLGTLMLRGFFGLEWRTTPRCESFQLKARVGYEAQLWTNQLRFSTFQLQRLHHDLTLQGMTLRCICSF